MLEKLILLHSHNFNTTDCSLFFSPGRINLIGEHTDYNGGFCLPCTINLGTYAVVSQNLNSTIRIFSDKFPEDGVIVVNLNNLLEKNIEYKWVNYLIGLLNLLKNNQINIPFGLDITISSNLPMGCGLSSSASLETLLITILDDIYELHLSEINKIEWCKNIENNFVGVSCGVMDQFVTMLGEKNKAILLNCTKLDTYQYINFNLHDYSLLIMNTNKPRYLVSSIYNKIVEECNAVVRVLQKKLPIKNLSDLSISDIEDNEYLLKEEQHVLRAKHVVNENSRTIDAAECLKNNQLDTFGILMKDSHVSLRDYYKVTGIELDSLVSAAWSQKECLGARMTGAGMGGCSISIVKTNAVEDFIKKVNEIYHRKTGLIASFYNITTVAGAHKILNLDSFENSNLNL